MKKIRLFQLVVFFFIFYGCSLKTKTYDVNILNKIPPSWSTEIETSNFNDDNWWSMFDDTLLDNYYQEFISKNPVIISVFGIKKDLMLR